MSTRPYFIHIRPKTETSVATKGGKTIAVVGDPDHGYRYGVAQCSIKDNYVKSKGRQLAAGRAFEKRTSFSLPDDIRTTKAAEEYLRHHYNV